MTQGELVIRALLRMLVLFILTSNVSGAIEFTGQVLNVAGAIEFTGQVLDDKGMPVSGVNLLVEEDGKLSPINREARKTNQDGLFSIDLATLSPVQTIENKMRQVVNFSKERYEQVIWVPDCTPLNAKNCRLKLRLSPVVSIKDPKGGNTVTVPSVKNAKIKEILSRYRSDTGKKIYLLLSDSVLKIDPSLRSTIQRIFKNNINDHLQGLPVIQLPGENTILDGIQLVLVGSIDELKVDENVHVQLQKYGNFLDALAMVYVTVGSLQQKSKASGKIDIYFHYQMVPSRLEFPSVREVVSLTASSSDIRSARSYRQISERWGFYTLLALCVRELVKFDRARSLGDRSGLELARAYLVAEGSRLGRKETLKKYYFRRLLSLVDDKLGKRSQR